MEDNRFKVSNQNKFILVIGLTGEGKSSFVNFITDKDKCEVSSLGSSCTQEFKMVDTIYGNANKIMYFVDTPGLDDADGDQKNIDEIKRFKNTVPRINAIIFCQGLQNQRFTESTKNLFQLMKDLYGNDPNLYRHLIIVRTKSDRQSRDFEESIKAAVECDNKNSFYNKIKNFFSPGDKEKISQYFLDSKYKDADSIIEKKKILDQLEKMDPIFEKTIREPIKKEEDYDKSKNILTIKETQTITYLDFDGQKKTIPETNTEIIDLNGIKEVKVLKCDKKTSNGICCWKTWKIIYEIFYVNGKNEEYLAKKIEKDQRNRNDDYSNKIRENEKKKFEPISS